MNKIGAVISNARKKAGLTQEALAAKLGITPQAVSKWENDVGYPDVTLLPEISKTLDISLDELFGTENSEAEITVRFPENKNGLPFVCSFGEVGCYSDKTVEKYTAEDGVVLFTDGSAAYIAEGMVINQGKGEIRFGKGTFDTKRQLKGQTSYEKTFREFDSIDLSLGLGTELEIISAKDGIGRIYAEGNEEFIALIKPQISAKTLTLSARKNGNLDGWRGNKIIIYAPFNKGKRFALRISGACEAKAEPFFEELSVHISGSGELEAKSCDTLELAVSGSSDVNIGAINTSANCRISGSGDLKIGTVNNIKATVSGSCDVSIGTATGVMDFSVNGAGDVEAGGDAKLLKLAINGAGDFKGKALTVDDAELTVGGSADIHIGHIKGRSTEKLSENSTLTVDRRGNN